MLLLCRDALFLATPWPPYQAQSDECARRESQVSFHPSKAGVGRFCHAKAIYPASSPWQDCRKVERICECDMGWAANSWGVYEYPRVDFAPWGARGARVGASNALILPSSRMEVLMVIASAKLILSTYHLGVTNNHVFNCEIVAGIGSRSRACARKSGVRKFADRSRSVDRG